MLFCEPKNRKSASVTLSPILCFRFSALLRAEKSEMGHIRTTPPEVCPVSVLFCEPKNRKCSATATGRLQSASFSALLRAEKSEIRSCRRRRPQSQGFQCSSASRKIGNVSGAPDDQPGRKVSVLFCEPKNRKCSGAFWQCFWRCCFSALLRAEKSEIVIKIRPLSLTNVSVLFCEPKNRKSRFPTAPTRPSMFQCSSASRKIGNRGRRRMR